MTDATAVKIGTTGFFVSIFARANIEHAGAYLQAVVAALTILIILPKAIQSVKGMFKK